MASMALLDSKEANHPTFLDLAANAIRPASAQGRLKYTSPTCYCAADATEIYRPEILKMPGILGAGVSAYKSASIVFTGEPSIYLPGGPAAIARKTRTSVLMGYCIRRPGNKTFEGIVPAPINYEPPLNGDKTHNIQMITQTMAALMEEQIRRCFYQWYMFCEIWPQSEAHNAEVKQ